MQTSAVALPGPGATVAVRLSGHPWRLTLTGATMHRTLSGDGLFATARAQGRFVLVYLTAVNAGTISSALGIDGSFSLLDRRGRTFTQTSDATGLADAGQASGRDWLLGTVQPSFGARGARLRRPRALPPRRLIYPPN